MKPGVILKILCCIVGLFRIQTLGVALFNLQIFPDCANRTEVLTSAAPPVLIGQSWPTSLPWPTQPSEWMTAGRTVGEYLFENYVLQIED
ncbi:hypothetical protein AVEN_17269-1 [Araneus ventricosus]|uniref:Uncharacterized protein n=1 Tax=Araneus ventricosus TaxID=182803 RepID=A0A4Y2F2M3_ARAVE|nr:hypothetical protein AVEN_17269-1 [Araneus ventricosus]